MSPFPGIQVANIYIILHSHSKLKYKTKNSQLKILGENELKLILSCLFMFKESLMFSFSGSSWPTSNHNARCPYCMRVFVNNTNLKIHIRDVHSVDKGPFICNKCGKIVKNRGSLRVHLYRLHRSFMC